MKDGEIAEQGTYEELINAGKEFAKLIEEYGEGDEEEKEKDIDAKSIEKKEIEKKKSKESKIAGEPSKALMITEERSTGSVDSKIYFAYLKAAGGFILLPLLFFFLVMMQATNIGYVLRFFFL
jgi:ATP-binding cassette, subfamily C (CFTR/MRP), member 1